MESRCVETEWRQKKWRPQGAEDVQGVCLMKASVSAAHSDQPPVRDRAAQAANYSNYDSLQAEINLIKRRLSRAH